MGTDLSQFRGDAGGPEVLSYANPHLTQAVALPVVFENGQRSVAWFMLAAALISLVAFASMQIWWTLLLGVGSALWFAAELVRRREPYLVVDTNQIRLDVRGDGGQKTFSRGQVDRLEKSRNGIRVILTDGMHVKISYFEMRPADVRLVWPALSTFLAAPPTVRPPRPSWTLRFVGTSE